MTTSAEDHYAPTPQGRIFARRWGEPGRVGDRAPIILLHDSLGCVELWRDFPAKLAAATGRGVVAYDRLGFGRSDPHPSTLGPDFIRTETQTGLSHLVAALGIETFVLFGHSVGGAMAVAAGAALPHRVEAVITEAAQAFIEARTLSSVAAARTAFRAPDQIERLARYHGDKARWVLDAWTETWLSGDFASWSLDEDLRRLRRPVLAMHGDRDEYGSTAFPERIVALAQGPARMVIFDDCGHVPHREQPDAVLTTVAGFIDRLRWYPAAVASEGFS
jgi:pimeloyl-ACP methyl ester carboxylesterase